MSVHFRIVVACLAAAGLAGCSQAQEPTGRDESAITEIRSIDPADTDFSDLRAIRESIGDARIVMLGEQSHGVGSAFLAKTRLVRFLHQELGFDVLAFESGFYDMYAAQKAIENGMPAAEALGKAITPVWARSKQLEPLLEYVGTQQSSDEPLVMAGIDSQFTNVWSRELPQHLKAMSEDLPGGSKALVDISAGLEELFSTGPSALKHSSVAGIRAQYEQAIADVDVLSPPDAAWWKQVLRSTSDLLAFMIRLPEQTPEVFNMRDAQMAENLTWLAEKAFPGSRIIVWAATSHVIKDRSVVDTEVAREMNPMGAYIHDRFGNDAYVLAFTAYEGETASFANGGAITSTGTAPEGSVEALLADGGTPYAFVDAAELARLPSKPRVSWAMGFEPMRADWEQVVDGFFFVRTNLPSEYRR